MKQKIEKSCIMCIQIQITDRIYRCFQIIRCFQLVRPCIHSCLRRDKHDCCSFFNSFNRYKSIKVSYLNVTAVCLKFGIEIEVFNYLGRQQGGAVDAQSGLEPLLFA